MCIRDSNECGSEAVVDDCGVCGGDGTTCLATLSLGAFDSSGSLEILYDFGSDILGFQFDVSGLALSSASGGAAGDAGFMVSVGDDSVLGISLTGGTISAGSGVLTVLSFSDITADATELSLGNSGAVVSSDGSTTLDLSFEGSIDHGDQDCAGSYYGDAWESDCGCVDATNSGDDCDDCAGTPNGDAVVDNCGTCDSDASNDCTQDCSGDWGGSLVVDDCGDCGGSNACHTGSFSLGAFDSSGSLEVLYDFGHDVSGFQFEVTGLTLAGGSGGAADDAGFDVQTGGSTVLGFSFTGSTIPAGSGVLTVLSFTSVNSDATDISMGSLGAITGSGGVVYTSSASGSLDHSDTQDCAGDYYGDAVPDNCGTCDSDSSNDCTPVSYTHLTLPTKA